MTDRPSFPLPGTWIDKYQVVRHLAQGGMAQVMLGREVTLSGAERLVVLKRILPNHRFDPTMIELFHDEIRIVMRLSHVGVAYVYDVFFHEDSTYIVMEYINGKTLREVERAQPFATLPLEHTLWIIARLCETLFYVHERRDEEDRHLGIVHRDVTPENVIISESGEVKLVDFGIARAVDQLHQSEAGVIRGKFAYLAPELCMGHDHDHRVDIYSLGVVLYELVTGLKIFERDTERATVGAILGSKVPRPSEVRSDLPRRLDDIVLRALHRDPDKRYQRADELLMDLEKLAAKHELHSNSVALRRFVSSFAGTQPTVRSPRLGPMRGGGPDTDSDPKNMSKLEASLRSVAARRKRRTPPAPPPGPMTPSWLRFDALSAAEIEEEEQRFLESMIEAELLLLEQQAPEFALNRQPRLAVKMMMTEPVTPFVVR